MSFLTQAEFTQAVNALPLISIDFCVLNPRQELLLGLRNNQPAQGYWFTPGGRIRKNEVMEAAKKRVGQDELGLEPAVIAAAQLMGAWDHLYEQSAFSNTVSTHYVNLPHRVNLSQAQAMSLNPPHGPAEQHRQWQWMPLEQAASHDAVHPYVRVYAQHLLAGFCG